MVQRKKQDGPLTRSRARSSTSVQSHENEDAMPSKKRALENCSVVNNHQPSKKRAVLGEVTNLFTHQQSSSNSQALSDAKKTKETRKISVGGTILNPRSKKPSLSSNVKSCSKETDENAASSNYAISEDSVSKKPSLSEKHEEGSKEKALEEKGSTHCDIDKGCIGDPQMCASYAQDIYQHLRNKELKCRPVPTYMDTVQNDITPNMRSILVDWLVEVSEEYKLLPDTLYLTINYIDRYLSANSVNRHNLQLLGVSCMLIASKFEELSPPHVEEFCYITDNTYTREEVVSMEASVLSLLNFELTTPTAKTFLRRFVRASQAESKVNSLQHEFLANYLTELTLLDCKFLRYLPSMVAASAVFLARLTLDCTKKPWNQTLKHYTSYRASELRDCVLVLYDFHKRQKFSTLAATRQKYNHHKFKCASQLLPPAAIGEGLFEDDNIVGLGGCGHSCFH